ncbi:hypothetical protein [Adlercreutzia sp. ZJ138]|uniref:hypothetical protein n=1 Tax=Adlercreutzia sp. ZJ138 TaxID=2709405 RepID=UPI0013EA6AA1|nr:hypothetical protein [Adlercreutzia sp. ZJ138]
MVASGIGAATRLSGSTARNIALGGMPVGRRSPRGRRRWYLVHAPGREQATCDKLRKILPPDLLEDAFVMRKERWRKYHGAWRLYPVPMYQEYFFVVTKDVLALDKELAKLTFPARIAKADGRHFAPLAKGAQQWYEGVLDTERVIRTSTAVIEDGVLHVQSGPLVGQEDRVVKVDRHKRFCFVDVDEGFAECVPLDVPFKS